MDYSNIYKQSFNVKYMQIETELIEKINVHEHANDKVEMTYTKEDVFAICAKLYSDELIYALKADMESTTDLAMLKINENILILWTEMSKNKKITKLIERIKDVGFNHHPLTPKDTFNFLFSYEIFHHFHLCICDFINNGVIENTNMDKLNMLVTSKLLKK